MATKQPERSNKKKARTAPRAGAKALKKPYTREDFDRDFPVFPGPPYPEGYTSLRDYLYG